MTYTTVLLLILIGLLIVLAEIFLVPGSTIIGVIGVILILLGIVGAFYSLGQETGFMVFGVTLLLIGILGYLGFKAKTWQRFAVKSAIDGKATVDAAKFHVGQEAITLTRCNPIGKARFTDGSIEEVYSSGDMIAENTPVSILRILDQKIIIKPKN
ncbi:MAG: hypothetical protein LC101_06920 [Flavobacteriales bacterium]|nr:NfeD family protein [Flavobacteriales bacterium]MCZ2443490.1 hypothetical protein [Flavobacteriales bacterium]